LRSIFKSVIIYFIMTEFDPDIQIEADPADTSPDMMDDDGFYEEPDYGDPDRALRWRRVRQLAVASGLIVAAAAGPGVVRAVFGEDPGPQEAPVATAPTSIPEVEPDYAG
jgi:hypothetical protein